MLHLSLTSTIPLSTPEKLIVVLFILLLCYFMYDYFRKKKQKERNKQMGLNLHDIIRNRWEELTDLLTQEDKMNAMELERKLNINFKQFDSKHKDILYHELVKIKRYHQVNPNNWNAFVQLINKDNSKK